MATNARAGALTWYAVLLRLYPRPFRERFGEGMAQTFHDLCREQGRYADWRARAVDLLRDVSGNR
jgi:hypothetical protein